MTKGVGATRTPRFATRKRIVIKLNGGHGYHNTVNLSRKWALCYGSNSNMLHCYYTRSSARRALEDFTSPDYPFGNIFKLPLYIRELKFEAILNEDGSLKDDWYEVADPAFPHRGLPPTNRELAIAKRKLLLEQAAVPFWTRLKNIIRSLIG